MSERLRFVGTSTTPTFITDQFAARKFRYDQLLWDLRLRELREIMEHSLQDTIALLARTPATLNALLRDLPESWTMQNEGTNTWNAFDIVGHLIHGERTDWMPRARMILQFGQKQTFVPFDRLGQVRESEGKTLDQLLDEFARLRGENLDELRLMNLRREDLEMSGKHPRLEPSLYRNCSPHGRCMT